MRERKREKMKVRDRWWLSLSESEKGEKKREILDKRDERWERREEEETEKQESNHRWPPNCARLPQ